MSLTLAEARLLRRLAGTSQKLFEAREADSLMRRGLAMLHPATQKLTITAQGERLQRKTRQDI